MIRVQSSAPYIEIGEVRHYVPLQLAKLAELLLRHPNKPIPIARIAQVLDSKLSCVYTLVCELRGILGPYGYVVVLTTATGIDKGYALFKKARPALVIVPALALEAAHL